MMMFYAGIFSGSLYAGSVTTVYLEPASASFMIYSGDIIRARVLLLDSAGTLATTLPDGTDIGEGTIELASQNFPTQVEFAFDEAVKDVSQLTFASGTAKQSLDTAGYVEFAFRYKSAEMIETGDDEITATLKQGTTVIASSKIMVKILAPLANVFVTRTGGINTLPGVLDELPPPQKDKGATRTAGDTVLIDVFAGYAADRDGNGIVDTLVFTDNVPAGYDTITIGSSEVALVNGHIATSITETSVTPSTLAATDSVASQLDKMRTLFVDGKTKTYGDDYSILPYAEIGTHKGDVGVKEIYHPPAAPPAPIVPWVNLDNAPASFVTNAISWLTDTAIFRPAKIAGVNIVGLPITGITGTFLGISDSSAISALDAFYYIGYEKIPKRISNFYVNGTPGLHAVYGAIIGYDQYNNPAPFADGTRVAFDLMVTPTTPTTQIYIGSNGWGTVVTNVITATSDYQSFLPIKIIPAEAPKNIVRVSLGLHGNNPMDKKLIEGVSKANIPFGVLNYAASVDVNAGNAIEVQAGGRDYVGITVTGTADGSSFDMSACTQSTGTAVKVNARGAAEAADTVSIPYNRDSKAEQDVSFYNTIPSDPSEQLRLIFAGNDNTIFVYKTGNAIISPADPGVYPPKQVSVKLEKNALLDSAEEHDTIATTAVSITDAFGNAYAGLYGANSENIEEADPTVEVFKSDGVTPLPGASAKVKERAVKVSFDLSQITPDNSQAKVTVSAGAGSGQFTVNLRALQNTGLENIFVPVPGVSKTPIEVFFADQSGALIAPVTMTAATTGAPAGNGFNGAFPVVLESVDGLIGSPSPSSTKILNQWLTTASPVYTFNAKPNTGKTVMTIATDGRDARAASTTLTLNFVPVDTIPPVIGAVTTSTCSITIACTDNEGLNLKGSTVVVRDSTGKDITSTLPPPALTGDGTAAGSITLTGVPVGLYTLDIAVKDTTGNIATGQKPANVTTCITGSCKSVDPAFAVRGRTLDVTITGENTNFGATSVVTFSDKDITVNSVTASSATEATPSSATEIVANITISATAAAAKSDVTVTTGFETVTCSQAFEITENPTLPSCVLVEPSTVNAGTTTDVTITLQDVDLTKVKGPLSVNFGCTGVSVTSTTVNVISATQLKVTIAVAATAQDCTGDVTITGTGDVGVVCKGAFKVVAAPPPPPVCSLNVSPSPVRSGIILPRIRTLTLTGTNSAWTSSSTVTIEGINTIIPLSRSANKISVLVFIPSKLRLVAGTKNVTVTTGTVQCKGTLVIQ